MKLSQHKHLHKHNGFTHATAGFTLMEVMVSVSIFAIVITIGIGSLLTIYSTLRKTRADQQVMDSLSFVMDTMTRQIRTGTEYSGGGSSITFRDQTDENGGGNVVTYESRPDSNNVNLVRLYKTDADEISYDITPDNLDIENFNIDIIQDGQPLVQINLSGVIKNGKKETPLSIQAAVSQRAFLSAPTGGSGGGATPIVPPCPPRQACPPPANL